MVDSMKDKEAQGKTLREKIDAKIKFHEQEIERLVAIRRKFPPSMLDMHICDVYEAMSL